MLWLTVDELMKKEIFVLFTLSLFVNSSYGQQAAFSLIENPLARRDKGVSGPGRLYKEAQEKIFLPLSHCFKLKEGLTRKSS